MVYNTAWFWPQIHVVFTGIMDYFLYNQSINVGLLEGMSENNRLSYDGICYLFKRKQLINDVETSKESFAVLISVRRNTAEDKTVLTTSCSVFGTSPVSITRIGSRLLVFQGMQVGPTKIKIF